MVKGVWTKQINKKKHRVRERERAREREREQLIYGKERADS